MSHGVSIRPGTANANQFSEGGSARSNHQDFDRRAGVVEPETEVFLERSEKGGCGRVGDGSVYAGAMKLTVYQKPTCTTCRQVHAALRESGVDFEAVDYYTDPIPRAKLLELIRKMGITPRQLLRTKEEPYRTLGLASPDVTDAEIVDAMVAHPDLIQRPIIEKGSRAILARPVERLKDIL